MSESKKDALRRLPVLFNSYLFIFIFLPLALAGYFGLNRLGQYRLGHLFLTLMSLWFYAYYQASYLWIILFSILWNYGCHCLLTGYKKSRAICAAGVFGNIALLFYFKYFTFVLSNLENVFHAGVTLPDIVMPLGISFFTFQQIAFVADSYRGTVARQNLIDYALFVTFFPQLIAGPIVNHEEMLPQFQDGTRKRPDASNLYQGIRIFVLGLGKKVLLADVMGQAVDWGFAYHTVLNGLNAWIIMVLYAMQLYFDFSGYCDMARGIGCMFNIELPVNFFSPYKARNIREFWDRWHMTLTRFFTRYVYIPLGGNKKGRIRTYVNVFLVFFISGIWHGAGWTFILWGILHGLLSVLTRFWQEIKEKMRLPRFTGGGLRVLADMLATALTFLFVTAAWTLFRADTVMQAKEILQTAFTFSGDRVFLEIAGFFNLSELWYLLKILHLSGAPGAEYYWFVLYMLAGLILLFGAPNIRQTEQKHRPGVIYTLALSGIAVWSIVSLSGVSTFLYFNF